MMLYEHLGQTVAEGKQGSSDGFVGFDSVPVVLYPFVQPFLVAICTFFPKCAETGICIAAEVAVYQQR